MITGYWSEDPTLSAEVDTTPSPVSVVVGTTGAETCPPFTKTYPLPYPGKPSPLTVRVVPSPGSPSTRTPPPTRMPLYVVPAGTGLFSLPAGKYTVVPGGTTHSSPGLNLIISPSGRIQIVSVDSPVITPFPPTEPSGRGR